MILIMTLWKRQNNGDSKKISGCQGYGQDIRGRDDENAEHSRFLGP